MVEILFFAILSGYLFFRLWSVLGDRSGFDGRNQPKNDNVNDVFSHHNGSIEEKDNVVLLPNRNRPLVEVNKEERGPFWEDFSRIQEKEKDFRIDDFLENAVHAFKMITQSFVDGDKESLQSLLTPKTYKQFCEVIDRRIAQGHRATNDVIGNVDVVIESVNVNRKKADITLKFTSHQRFITYDDNGVILDNPEEISTKMVNFWTFTKELGDLEDPTWYLSQTRVDA